MADGQVFGEAISDLYHEHVHKSGAGDGRYGFRIAFNDTTMPLERISVVIDDHAHPFRLPLTQQAMAAVKASAAPAYIGLVDSVAPGLVEGWAIDRHDLGRHLHVKATAGGHLLGGAICDLYREHLHKVGAGDGQYGFRIAFETAASIEDISVIVDNFPGMYKLPLAPHVLTALNRSKHAHPGGGAPDIAPRNDVTKAPAETAIAALESRVQTLHLELAQFKRALGQSVEKLVRRSAETKAFAPLTEELRDASPIPAEQLPWEARGIYHQLLQKLSALS
jgi:hypothetical protein